MLALSVRRLAALALAVLAVAACDDSDDDTGPDPAEAEVRVMNGASAASAVDLRADGALVLGNVPYGTTSAYADVPAGARALTVHDAGTGAQLAALDATLDEGQAYSLLAASTALALVQPSPVDTGQPLPDRANIRFLNVAPPFDSATTPPPLLLDVHLTDEGAELSGHAPQLTMDAEVPSYSSLVYTDPGSLEVRYTTTGTTTVVTGTGAFPAAAGEVWAVILERLEGGGFSATVLPE